MLIVAAGCGGGSTTTPDVTDTPGDQEDREDADEGGDADVDADLDVDADEDADAGDDGGEDDAGADADADATTKHTVTSLTAGGGHASSPGYHMTLTIGTPQPMGAAQSDTYRAQVGPGAVVNQ
jgi:hypothetical protein